MFKVQILLPEKTFIDMEINVAILEAEDGEIGILKNHAPLITLLKKNAKIKLDDKVFSVYSAHAHFIDNILKITCIDVTSFT